jgi:Tfp pilus assembly protein PilF
LGLAAACAKRGALEAAIAHLKDLLGAAPDHELANGMLGGIYAELKMPERATACYERVLATNPRSACLRTTNSIHSSKGSWGIARDGTR